MNTMSLFESGDSDGRVSLKDLLDNKLQAIITGEVSLKRLAEYIICGMSNAAYTRDDGVIVVPITSMKN